MALVVLPKMLQLFGILRQIDESRNLVFEALKANMVAQP